MMRTNPLIKVFFLAFCLFFTSASWALNPLYEARYQIFPERFKKHRTEFQTSPITHFESDLLLPFSFIFGINNSLEFGSRIQLDSRRQTFNNENVVVRGDLGLQANLRNGDLLQVDFVFGIGSGNQEGVNASYTIFRSVTKRLSMAWQAQASFGDGLNGEEFTVVEFGFYPRFRLITGLDFIGSLTYSSSPISIQDYSAFDVAPGLEFKLGGPSKLMLLVFFGAAGDHSEQDILWKFGLTHDF